MWILSRKSSAAKVTSRMEGLEGRAPRRVEITVEREIVSVLVRGRTTANGKSGVPCDSPFICPGSLFAGPLRLGADNGSCGETNPLSGANVEVVSKTGGVLDFTVAQLFAQAFTVSQVLRYSSVTRRPGFMGTFMKDDSQVH